MTGDQHLNPPWVVPPPGAGPTERELHERQVASIEGLQDTVAEWRDELKVEEANRASLEEVFGSSPAPPGALIGEDTPHKTTHCLDHARALVTGDRAEAYGDPRKLYERVAASWCAYLEIGLKDLDARDAANMMVILKTCRDRVMRKQDNLVDIAGYAQVASWIGDPQA